MTENFDILREIKRYNDMLRVSGYSRKTIKSYVYYISGFLGFSKGKISKESVRRYLLYIMANNKDVSMRVAVAAVRLYLSEVGKKELIMNVVYPRSGKSLPMVLTREEVIRMIEAISNIKHRLIIEMIYSTGLRLSELRNLRVRDLDFNEGMVYVKEGKNSKDRRVIMSKNLAARLQDYIELEQIRLEENLFLGRRGVGLSTRTIQQVVKNAAKKAGISKNVHTHTLRHSFATHLLEQGVDIRHIQRLLGHAKLDTTQIYTHISVKDLKKIVNPLDVLYAEKETRKRKEKQEFKKVREKKQELYNSLLSMVNSIKGLLTE